MKDNIKKIFRIALKAPDRKTLFSFIKELNLQLGGRRPVYLLDDSWCIEVYLPERFLESLKEKDAVFEIIEDATKTGEQRQKEVGRGDRFWGGKKVPHGLGRKE